MVRIVLGRPVASGHDPQANRRRFPTRHDK